MADRAKRNGSKPQRQLVLGGRRMIAAYRVPELQPETKGPWSVEPDKVAWVDPDTGMACIVRRNPEGHLSGFVGIAESHPLYGYTADAIPADAVDVPGGIDYAEPCDETGPEERSVCHIRVLGGGDVWWVGMSCNRIDDLVPGDPGHAHEAQRLGIGQTYRDIHEVVGRCGDLARQLKRLVAEGEC